MHRRLNADGAAGDGSVVRLLSVKLSRLSVDVDGSLHLRSEAAPRQSLQAARRPGNARNSPRAATAEVVLHSPQREATLARAIAADSMGSVAPADEADTSVPTVPQRHLGGMLCSADHLAELGQGVTIARRQRPLQQGSRRVDHQAHLCGVPQSCANNAVALAEHFLGQRLVHMRPSVTAKLDCRHRIAVVGLIQGEGKILMLYYVRPGLREVRGLPVRPVVQRLDMSQALQEGLGHSRCLLPKV